MKHLFKINLVLIIFCYTAHAQNIPGIYTSAGPGQSICASWEAQLNGYMGDSVASPVWSTSGDGAFSDSNALSAVYTPGPGDIAAHSAILTLKANHIGLPYSVSDQMVLTIIPSVPSQPDPITGVPVTACPPLDGIILRTNNDPEATNYVWASDHPGVNFVPPSTADTQVINLNPITTAAYLIYVSAFNLCGASPARYVSIRRTVNVSVLNGSFIACRNTTKPYSCNRVTGAVYYKWKSTSGIKFNNHSSPYITADTIVNASFNSSFNSGNISVAAMTPCFTGPFKTLSVSNSLQALTPVTGMPSVCPVTSEIYSVSAVSGAASYAWTLPANTSGSSASNMINLNFENSFADTGNLCVTATSICGTATAPVCKSIIKAAPLMPGNISGPVIGICGQTVAYSVASVQGVSYNWLIPEGASITGPENGNSIRVTIPSDMSVGYIQVSAANNCGSSPFQNLIIKGRPAKPGDITTNINPISALTPRAQFSSNVSVLGSGCTLAWTYPASANYIDGQNTPNLILNWGNDNGFVTLLATNSCGTSVREYYVNVNAKREIANPDEPGINLTGKETAGNVSNVQAYPDADHKSLTITFFAPAAAVYFYSLHDDSNGEVRNDNIDADEGVNMIEIDMTSLPSYSVYRFDLSSGKDATHINIKME
jgi:hypothetical protein